MHYLPSYYKNPIKSIMELRKIMTNRKINIIHIHVNSLLNISPIILAQKRNIRIVIHSHSSANGKGGKIGKLLHHFNKFVISKYDITNLACSAEAGDWMFKKSNYEILYNGIDTDKYRYNSKMRSYIRNKYDIKENEYLIGHVGRFVEVKNHDFFMNCVKEMIDGELPVKAILVGDGPLKRKLTLFVEKNKLENKIIFVGQVSNVNDYYSAFDLMLFPSKYEGMPFTLIEAQTSGVPIIASDSITKQANVTGLITYLSLKLSVNEWNIVVKNNLHQHINRSEYGLEMKKTVFNIEKTVIRIEEIYEKVDIE